MFSLDLPGFILPWGAGHVRTGFHDESGLPAFASVWNSMSCAAQFSD